MKLHNERGIALTLVLMTALIISAMLAAAIMSSYNQKRVTNKVTTERTQSYYFAQAGVVDAFWRIRNDQDVFGGTFTVPTYDPPPYFLDVDNDVAQTAMFPGADVSVDISAQDTNVASPRFGLRTIDSTGIVDTN